MSLGRMSLGRMRSSVPIDSATCTRLCSARSRWRGVLVGGGAKESRSMRRSNTAADIGWTDGHTRASVASRSSHGTQNFVPELGKSFLFYCNPPNHRFTSRKSESVCRRCLYGSECRGVAVFVCLPKFYPGTLPWYSLAPAAGSRGRRLKMLSSPGASPLCAVAVAWTVSQTEQQTLRLPHYPHAACVGLLVGICALLFLKITGRRRRFSVTSASHYAGPTLRRRFAVRQNREIQRNRTSRLRVTTHTVGARRIARPLRAGSEQTKERLVKLHAAPVRAKHHTRTTPTGHHTHSTHPPTCATCGARSLTRAAWPVRRLARHQHAYRHAYRALATALQRHRDHLLAHPARRGLGRTLFAIAVTLEGDGQQLSQRRVGAGSVCAESEGSVSGLQAVPQRRVDLVLRASHDRISKRFSRLYHH